MVIRQGDIYWIYLDDPVGSEPGYVHPHLVVQNNVFNASRINTVVVCALTSNLKHAEAPGNVRLNKGEAGLPKQSVVNMPCAGEIVRLDCPQRAHCRVANCLRENDHAAQFAPCIASR
ncbi:MAG: type II toxin-antitoxin system PemK/MazF family toxin, partial [Sulfuricellaceae bacterium]